MNKARRGSQKIVRPQPASGPEARPEAPRVEVDRRKAFQEAVNELRTHPERYLKAPDLGTAVREVLGHVGVDLTDAQSTALFRAIGASGNVKPGDTGALRDIMGRVQRKVPGAPGAPGGEATAKPNRTIKK